MAEDFSHRAGRVGRVFEAGFQDVEDRFGLGQDIRHSPFVPGIEFDVHSVLILLVDVIEIGLPVVVVDVWDWFEFAFVATGEVDFAIEVFVDFHIFENVLIGGLELVQPLQDVLLNNKKTVEHLVGFYVEILSPLHDIGSGDHDPVVFETHHSGISHHHRPTCASQTSQKDTLEGRSLVVETGKVGNSLVDLEGRSSVQLFEPLGEVLGRGVHFLTHHFLDSLICHLEDVVELVDALQDGVDQSIANN